MLLKVYLYIFIVHKINACIFERIELSIIFNNIICVKIILRMKKNYEKC